MLLFSQKFYDTFLAWSSIKFRLLSQSFENFSGHEPLFANLVFSQPKQKNKVFFTKGLRFESVFDFVTFFPKSMSALKKRVYASDQSRISRYGWIWIDMHGIDV